VPIIASRDWHPQNHSSFVEQGGRWSRHCMQETVGAELHPNLQIQSITKILSKGMNPIIDQYSAFDTGELIDWLKSNKVRRLFIVGLALDYCVKATSLDAVRFGLQAYLIENCTKPVNMTSGIKALSVMKDSGVIIV
jgi:nicotinamidase/pyrazinamidase